MVLQYLIKVYCIKVSVLMGSPTNLIYIISPHSCFTAYFSVTSTVLGFLISWARCCATKGVSIIQVGMETAYHGDAVNIPSTSLFL